MAVITDIRPTKRDPDRATIRVDGRVRVTLSYAHINDLDLQIGQEWTPQLESQLDQARDLDQARRYAMRLIGRRAYSRRTLADRMRRKEFSPEAIEQSLDRLQQLGLLDDRAFGRAVLRDLARAKPAGRRLMERKLVQKGLDRELARELTDEAASQTDPLEQAKALAQRRLPALQRLDPTARKRRLWSLLARRGFEPDTIEQALRHLPSDADADETDALPADD